MYFITNHHLSHMIPHIPRTVRANSITALIVCPDYAIVCSSMKIQRFISQLFIYFFFFWLSNVG